MIERIGYREKIKHGHIVRGLLIGVKVAELLETEKFSADTDIYKKWTYSKNSSTNLMPGEIKIATSIINSLGRKGFCTVKEYFYLKNIPDNYLYVQGVTEENKYFAVALFPKTEEERQLINKTKEILQQENL
jgi:hypothetical protein